MSSSSNRLQQIAGHIRGEQPTDATRYTTSLEGKVCIVTGAGSPMGIGRAACWAFAHSHAAVVYLTDISGDLAAAAAEIQKACPKTKVIGRQVNAASEKDVVAVIEEAIKTHDHLDVFFANAGVASAARIGDTSLETYNRVMRINGESVFLAVKYAGAAMAKTGGGSIVLTASVAGVRSGAGSLDYSASKAAVISMAKTGCAQYAGANVRVNAVCPGLIETNMTKAVFDGARSRNKLDKVGQLAPLLRYGHASEVASAALFLASDLGSYVNGQAIPVDGGLSASLPVVPGKFF